MSETTLRALIDRHGTLAVEHSVFIIRACCRALAVIPIESVSPESIIVSSRGEVKLRFDRDRISFAYLSPEQAAGGPSDARTMVFSAAAVLWELLTSTRLFAAPTDHQTIDRVRDAEIPASLAAVPEPLAAIVRKALARDPNERYGSPLAFDAALARSCATVSPAEIGLLVDPGVVN